MSDFKTFSIYGRQRCKSFVDLKDFLEEYIPSGAVETPNLHDVEMIHLNLGKALNEESFGSTPMQMLRNVCQASRIEYLLMRSKDTKSSKLISHFCNQK